MTGIIIVVSVLISLAIGVLIGMAYRKKIAESKVGSAEQEAKRLVDLAKIEAENLKKEEIIKAKEEIMNSRKELDQEIKERRGEVQKQEARLIQKEELLERRSENFEKKEQEVEKRLQEVDAKKLEIEDLYAEEINKLQEIAALTKEEAKDRLLKEVEKEIHFPIFLRTRKGITVTAEGLEFIGYARQVIQQMNVMQDDILPRVRRKRISTFAALRICHERVRRHASHLWTGTVRILPE